MWYAIVKSPIVAPDPVGFSFQNPDLGILTPFLNTLMYHSLLDAAARNDKLQATWKVDVSTPKYLRRPTEGLSKWGDAAALLVVNNVVPGLMR